MQIQIQTRSEAPRQVNLFEGRAVTLGRDPGCELHIADPRLSRRHAELLWENEALRFNDLGSANGCLLNGAPAASGLLQAGDVLMAGDTRISRLTAKPAAQWDAPNFHVRLLERLNLRELTDETLKQASFKEKVRVLALELAERDQPASSREERQHFVTAVLNEVFGLGPLEALLADDGISEIMVNAPDEIWIERHGKLAQVATVFANDAAVRRVIDRIVSPLGRRVDESSPLVDARLPDGSRVNAVISPVSLKGATLTIRKFRKQRITPEDLLQWGSIDREGLTILRTSVETRKNIMVSGGTGSGKTTLLNTLGGFIDPAERIITIEDAAELQLPQPNVVRLESRPANLEGKGAITIRDLLKNSLRMRPDRIIVGECRGGEALDMLQAMNTGHDGSLSTVHANTPADALRRIETLVLFAGTDLPHRAVREQVASAIHVIVQQSRMKDGSRRVTSIVAIEGLGDDGYVIRELWSSEQTLLSASS